MVVGCELFWKLSNITSSVHPHATYAVDDICSYKKDTFLSRLAADDAMVKASLLARKSDQSVLQSFLQPQFQHLAQHFQ